MPANDDQSFQLNLPFSFTMYDTTYNTLYINNNGNITFQNSFGSFSAAGFPAGGSSTTGDDTIMIAPFWADIDTRPAGNVYYSLTSTHLIVKWNSVGYYDSHSDKLNDFQLIITNGTDSILPDNNNAAFCYGDMQWSTGDASSGIGGFGGIPATAGINKGDGITYFQVGRFDSAGTSYDGPYGNNDGVDFLDNQSYYFNTSGLSNIPPLVNNLLCDTVDIFTSDTTRTLNYDWFQFMANSSSPEPYQSVVTTFTCTAPGALTATQVQNTGSFNNYDCLFSGIGLSPGVYTVTITATDNGTPSKTSIKNIYFRVNYDAAAPTVITDHDKAMNFEIYPNPAMDKLTVEYTFDKSSPVIVITDIAGSILQTDRLSEETQTFDISNLKSGVYFITIKNDKGLNKTEKLIKKQK
jgi:hypothetical protein